MGWSTKKLKFIILSSAVCTTVISFFVIIPTNTDLVMTPSTHEEIVFLRADATKIDEGAYLRFAAHDLECNYVQLCFSVSKQNEVLFCGSKLQIFVDNSTIDKYSIITKSTWKRKYIMVIISDVSSFSNIKIDFEENSVTIV